MGHTVEVPSEILRKFARAMSSVISGPNWRSQRSSSHSGWERRTARLGHATGSRSTFRSTAFANPAAGTLGTCGRDSGRGPNFQQLDLNIVKEFKFASRSRIQARWEIFNLTNHVNLGGFLSTSTRSSSFGKIGSTPDVDRGNPVLGTGGPRAMQWAMKVLF